MPLGSTVFIRASTPANYILETSRKLIKTTEAVSVHAENFRLPLCEVGPEKPVKASWQILTTTLLLTLIP